MSSKKKTNNGFSKWAIVELMGHVRLAGRVTEEELFGVKMGRIDIYTTDPENHVTQYFGGQSVYRITPCTQQVAMAMATETMARPIGIFDVKRIQNSYVQTTLEETTQCCEDGDCKECNRPFEGDETCSNGCCNDSVCWNDSGQVLDEVRRNSQ